MSRRIVQISAVASTYPDRNDSVTELYALDNNGIAWMMADPNAGAIWYRLAPLPSLDNRPPRAQSVTAGLNVPASSLEQAEGIEP